jgi:hypothetical protein
VKPTWRSSLRRIGGDEVRGALIAYNREDHLALERSLWLGTERVLGMI